MVINSGEAAIPTTTSAKRLVNGVVTLISLPDVYLRLDELLRDQRASLEDMGVVIRNDPATSTRLLKLVNSAFYGFPSRVESLSRAISIIGTQPLKELVLSAVAISTFNRISSGLVDMSRFWHHSVYCGLIARILARRCNVLHPERLFTAGLLHDVGQLIIYHTLPELAGEALATAGTSDQGMFAAEQRVIGFTHAEVARELFQQWNLPTALQEAAAHHHDPGNATRFPLEAALVHLANSAANRVEPGRNLASCEPEVDPQAWRITGLDESALEQSLSEAHPQFFKVIQIIAMDKPAM